MRPRVTHSVGRARADRPGSGLGGAQHIRDRPSPDTGGSLPLAKWDIWAGREGAPAHRVVRRDIERRCVLAAVETKVLVAACVHMISDWYM